ncbi:SMI1/KNR4 family protein [Streptomyces sp. WAC07149]|uniref:SMI1/KNR4 family protein n=1 Tax=Streptomyces sp. WAC07149 TaxID=2487425 RepID=UPI000F7959B7|nr:SMI1/KNR4 family protein [Streptomyces sp. WAC07149]RST07706.1 SMI1/KNR4 family protein [Streptomyces sp. WAC07149]
MQIDDWEPFLRTWSAERETAMRALEPSEPPLGWLGFDPAPPERIAALEARLGAPLPPSYRSFLEVTDGWRWAGEFVYLLAPAAEVGPLRELTGHLFEMLSEWEQEDLEEDLDEEEEDEEEEDEEEDLDDGDEEPYESERWGRAIQISLDGDQTWLMLDPGDVNADGEWAAYRYSSWSGEGPERHESFADLMYAEFQGFHALRKPDGETRRGLAARVERARADLLAGRAAEAERALEEAREFGYGPATVYLFQIRALRGEHYMLPDARSELAQGDPLLGHAVLPVLAVIAEGDPRPHRPEDPELDGYRRRYRDGVHRAWEDGALERARDLARWGDPEEAWRVLAEEALPRWRPVGDGHVLPVELMADPFLRPLVTSERAARILATPRPGTAVPAGPGPAGPGDPGSLLESGPGPSSRWIGFARGTTPRELALRLGADPDSVGPCLGSMGSGRHSAYEDRDRLGVLHVGVAEDGWSFALEADTGRAEPGGAPFAGVELWRESPAGPVQFRYADPEGRVVWSLTAPPGAPYDPEGPLERGGSEPGLLDAGLAAAGLLRADGRVPGRDPGLVAAVARHFGLRPTPGTSRLELLPVLRVPRPPRRPGDAYWERS